jgi:hypothetical protein
MVSTSQEMKMFCVKGDIPPDLIQSVFHLALRWQKSVLKTDPWLDETA